MAPARMSSITAYVFFLSIQGLLWQSWRTVNCLQLAEEPENTTVSVGQSVVLRCVFDGPVDACQWRRIGHPLFVDGRYNYVRGNGSKTNDCSLKINKVDTIDFNEWMCEGMSRDSATVRSPPFQIVRHTFVGIHKSDGNDLTIVSTIDMSDGEIMKMKCSLFGSSNESSTTYLWEYKRNSTEPWETHATDKETLLTDQKLGHFRCSSKLNGERHYSLDYFVRKSENSKIQVSGSNYKDILLVIAGAVTGIVMAFAIAVIVIRRNYAIKYKKIPREETDDKQITETLEMEPLMNNAIATIRTTRPIDEPSPGGTVFDWEIKDYKTRKMEEAKGQRPFLQSEEFRVAATDYYFRVKLYLNGCGEGKNSFMSVLLELTKPSPPSNDDFHHKRKILVLDQSGQGRHLCWEYEPSFNSEKPKKWMKNPWGPVDFFSSAALKYGEARYVKKGSIIIRIIIEALMSLTNHIVLELNEPGFRWKIDNYYQRQQDEKDDVCRCLESEPFYCFPWGYRVKCMVYLNGCGKGRNKHISIFYGFINGQFDNILAPVFPHQAVIKILDQSNLKNGNHIKRKHQLSPNEADTEEGANKMKGFHGFVSFTDQKSIQKDPYLVDGSLLIEIVIQQLDKSDRKGRFQRLTSLTYESDTMKNPMKQGTDVENIV